MKIETISPLGFCPGAKRAIPIFKQNAPRLASLHIAGVLQKVSSKGVSTFVHRPLT
jgi:4-hydroxy-3-methylbut-2-enyl diphosphate reductase IspH